MGQVCMESLLQPLGSFLEAEVQREKNLSLMGIPTSRRGVIPSAMCWDQQPKANSPGTHSQLTVLFKSPCAPILHHLAGFSLGISRHE